MSVRVDRCVCSAVTFERLKAVAKVNNVSSLDELSRHHPFGVNCRRCHPYVEKMLQDGTIVFHHLIEMKTGPLLPEDDSS